MVSFDIYLRFSFKFFFVCTHCFFSAVFHVVHEDGNKLSDIEVVAKIEEVKLSLLTNTRNFVHSKGVPSLQFINSP